MGGNCMHLLCVYHPQVQHTSWCHRMHECYDTLNRINCGVVPGNPTGFENYSDMFARNKAKFVQRWFFWNIFLISLKKHMGRKTDGDFASLLPVSGARTNDRFPVFGNVPLSIRLLNVYFCIPYSSLDAIVTARPGTPSRRVTAYTESLLLFG